MGLANLGIDADQAPARWVRCGPIVAPQLRHNLAQSDV